MTQIDKTKPVLVTGGSGYAASWIINLLLDKGIDVHTTVRDKSNENKYRHLFNIAKNSSAKLEVFEADLLKDGSFDDAFQGCELVMHTASPFLSSGIKDAQKQLIDPALKGTRNVLNSANKTSGLKRIVLTSSVAAIYGDSKEFQQIENGVFTEKYWNTTSNLKHGAYSFSKTLAEQAAWEMAKLQDQWDLVVVNPSFILGPSLTKRKDSASIEIMSGMGNGTYKSGVMELWFGVVDVRDVAKAHFQAWFKSDASGRHILCSDSIPLLEIANILREKYGNKYPFPKSNAPKPLAWLIAPMFGMTRKYVAKNVGYPVKFDNSYTKKDLEMDFRPIKETVLDHFQQLIEDDQF
jgi:nucleoside-diphosphate-sugar epimerase